LQVRCCFVVVVVVVVAAVVVVTVADIKKYDNFVEVYSIIKALVI